MNRITLVLAILFFILPSISSAAALTQQQSTSLIAVVQSSPGTPANAFVSLITAFSNITTAQASSLITVVQASPSTPAGAFVDLLTSFTDDTSVAQTPAIPDPTLGVQITILNQQLEDLKQQNAETQAKLGQIVQNTTPAPTEETPALPSVTKELDVEVNGLPTAKVGVPYGIVASYKENGKKLPNIPITFSAPSGKFMFGGLNEPGSNAGKFLNPTTLPTSPEATGIMTNTAAVSYFPDTTISPTENPVDDNNNWVSEEGGRFYPGVLITVSANGITRTVQGNRVYKVSK